MTYKCNVNGHNYIGAAIFNNGTRQRLKNQTLERARNHLCNMANDNNVVFAWFKNKTTDKLALVYVKQFNIQGFPPHRPKKFPNLSRLYIHRNRARVIAKNNKKVK